MPVAVDVTDRAAHAEAVAGLLGLEAPQERAIGAREQVDAAGARHAVDDGVPVADEDVGYAVAVHVAGGRSEE